MWCITLKTFTPSVNKLQPSTELAPSAGLETAGSDNCFRIRTDELMDVHLQHLDLGRAVLAFSFFKKIKSYQHHASLEDDIISLVSIISSLLLLITLHIIAWKGRTDRPARQPADRLSTTWPLHSQTQVVTPGINHTLARLFSPRAWNSTFTSGDRLHARFPFNLKVCLFPHAAKLQTI